jgi:hypothetical protein
VVKRFVAEQTAQVLVDINTFTKPVDDFIRIDSLQHGEHLFVLRFQIGKHSSTIGATMVALIGAGKAYGAGSQGIHVIFLDTAQMAHLLPKWPDLRSGSPMQFIG